ncbi:MAG TPA: HDOD domain-containing protein [Candidatus Accumulibacter phosphatis]|nr:MAG: putative domain HDIG [Candidatus Accumulibacter sp. SK-11]HAY26488.1 HDOD domain-containing protein [Accumulibacter sp.]HCN68435.1 HDOD domain-containing protein [Accumulibacter sp.]HRL76226.1 HDOD domain-containing protein [Candidatus Accumulibacter phosphatis]HRQ94564.1 HDOD domain-containing protein [Candidatus Accumulibacter phosphatis]
MSNQLSFRILEDIARDLSGEVVSFPTFLDITFQVRSALKNPLLTVDELGRLVAAEPLMSTKVIRLANSAAINRSGRAIVDVRSAIARIGMEAVRTVSFAVAMEQLLNSKKMAPFQDLSRRLWEHTMHVAALSRVLARRLTRVNADEALFAGLVHDIGVFYLLSRAVNFPELVASPRDLHQLLVQWHDHIGHALLAAMSLPEELVLVVQEHELDRAVSGVATLADIVFVANRLSGVEHGWRDAAFGELPDASIACQFFDADALATLLAESADDVNSLKAALGS